MAEQEAGRVRCHLHTKVKQEAVDVRDALERAGRKVWIVHTPHHRHPRPQYSVFSEATPTPEADDEPSE